MGADQGLTADPSPGPTRVFYDGGCGLCQGTVRFAARRDVRTRFRFAPLGGPTFLRILPAEVRAGLPDSLVVVTDAGRVLLRSEAVLHVLRQLGPPWPALAAALAWVPAPVRDAAYRLVARLRRRQQGCVLAAPEDGRFEP